MKLRSPIPAAIGLAILTCAITARMSPQRVERLISAVSPAPDLVTSKHYTLVEGSIEGDGFRVNDGNQELTVRLCGLHLPEQDQALGIESREHLRTLIARGHGQVTLVATDTESEHIIAEAFIPIADSEEEVHINSQMLADGMALIHPQSISICPNDGPMRTAQSRAEKAALGVWASPTAQNP